MRWKYLRRKKTKHRSSLRRVELKLAVLALEEALTFKHYNEVAFELENKRNPREYIK